MKDDVINEATAASITSAMVQRQMEKDRLLRSKAHEVASGLTDADVKRVIKFLRAIVTHRQQVRATKRFMQVKTPTE